MENQLLSLKLKTTNIQAMAQLMSEIFGFDVDFLDPERLQMDGVGVKWIFYPAQKADQLDVEISFETRDLLARVKLAEHRQLHLWQSTETGENKLKIVDFDGRNWSCFFSQM
jgi:hypothetical protein